MAQLFSDDFNRADENPLSGGGNWTAGSGSFDPCQLVSNKVRSSTASIDNIARRSGGTAPGSSHYAQATITRVVTTCMGGVVVRLQGDGAGAAHCYLLRANYGANNFIIDYFDNAAGTFTPLGATFGTFASGDVLRFEAIGSLLVASQNGNILATRLHEILTGGSPGLTTLADTLGDIEVDTYSDGNVDVTRFYLPASGAPSISPAFAAGWEDTEDADRVAMVTTKSNTAMANKTADEAVTTNNIDVLARQYIGPALAAQTISGTVRGIIRVLESAAGANARAQMVVRVVSGDGGTVRGTLLDFDTSAITEEFGTSAQNRRFPVGFTNVVLNPVTCQAGDRLVVEIGSRGHNTSGTNFTLTYRFGDPTGSTDCTEDITGTADNAPWLEFSPALTVQAGGITLAANGGSYALTGGAATLTISSTLVASGGVYALTGSAIGFVRTILGDPGVYTLTGGAVGLKRTIKLTAAGGGYALTGGAVTFTKGRALAASAGSYGLTGGAVNLRISRRLVAQGGTYAVSGQAAMLKLGRRLVAASGAYALTGGAATFTKGRALVANGGTYALTGGAVTLAISSRLDAQPGTYAITGGTAGLRISRRLVATSGAYALTGQDVTFREGLSLAAAGGSYALTGGAVGLRISRRLVASSGTAAITGQTVGLRIGRRLIAASGTYTLTGQDASLTLSFGNRTLFAEGGAYALTGGAVGFIRSLRLPANGGTYNLTGQNASLEKNRYLSAAGATYTLSGAPATLRKTHVLPAGTGAYAATGQDLTLRIHRRLIAQGATYTLTGGPATLFKGQLLSADSGSYQLTGVSADIRLMRRLAAASGAYLLTGSTMEFVFNRQDPTSILPSKARQFVFPATNRRGV